MKILVTGTTGLIGYNLSERLLKDGHEVFGISQKVIDLCDECIEIPQFGTKHSLNIAISTGIVMWEVWKKNARI